jgi:type IV pilus assembly protein PilA
MNSTLKTRVQLELLKKLRDKKGLMQKGFTLVELMIVVAIVGILSAVALPQYLQARNSAAAGSAVGEALGLGKECATFVASGVGAAPASAGSATVTCAGQGTTGSVVSTFTAGPVGIRCLTSTSVAANSKVTVAISAVGSLSCSFA